MLEHVKLHNVGPATHLELDLGPRLNLLTGDNGLGKSFLLDIAWWALTRTWVGLPALPHPKKKGTISFRFEGKSKTREYMSTFDRQAQAWTGKAGRPPNPGLVLYAQADGGFSVWDPARNYWRKKGHVDVQDRPAAYLFRPKAAWAESERQNVWDGLEADGNVLCNGLIRDWVSWQKEAGEPFHQLEAALRRLSVSDGEELIPGKPTRISLNDVRDMPTLRMPYGQDVPVTHASAGMKRILGLAYLLIWAWQEHLHASELLGQQPARQVIFLIDEVESHLHPRWQRTIMRSLLATMEALTSEGKTAVQLVAATHSPLVLASLEPIFGDDDAWFDLDLREARGSAEVVLERRAWVRHGDAVGWLTSDAFDLASARSIEAEAVLERAAHALADESFDASKASALHEELRGVLADTDPFWMNWRYVGKRRGWLP